MEISKLHSNFGTDEKIVDYQSARYQKYDVQYTENLLFSSQKQSFNLSKLSDIRKKLPYSTPMSKAISIEALRGIRIEKLSEPIRKTSLNVHMIEQNTKQNQK